jgi:thiol:disulfide interchange protein DsbA
MKKMNKVISKVTLSLAGIISLLLASANINAEYDEGIEYIKLTPEVTTHSDKIEVRELFWYYCGHCYSLEDNVEEWLAVQDKDIDFVRHPAVFSKKWESGAKFFHILDELGLVESHSMKLFKEIHENKNPMKKVADLLNWIESTGVVIDNKEKYLKRNFNIFYKTNKSKRTTKKYKITGVPSVVVNGKYVVTTKTAGSEVELFKVVDYLVDKERKDSIK